jgi:hypothetical protein
VADFGKRAFRRALGAEEIERYTSLFDTVTQQHGSTPARAQSLVLQAILLSPDFLYKRELGATAPQRDASGNVALTGYEVASRLSYFFWASMPDQQLFDAAESGALLTPDGVEAQARRLLQTEQARETVQDFHGQWLGVNELLHMTKSQDAFPEWDEQLAQDMFQEFQAFVSDAVFDAPVPGIAALLSSPIGFVNQRLATIYDLESTTPALTRTEVDSQQRRGLLTLPAFLATHSGGVETLPPRLGHVLYAQLLCQPMPAIPAVVPDVEPPAPGLTTRERFAKHAESPCASCHKTLDPLGFAFENYDAIGRYRDMDQGKAVDASGALTLPTGETFEFANAIELIQQLEQSKTLSCCMTRQWRRFALGGLENASQRTEISELYAGFQQSGFDVRELLVALVSSRDFMMRSPAEGEPMQ